MAVYERTYKRYVGVTSPQWARFLVLPRYVFQDVFKSKLFLIFFVLSFVYPLVNGALIYLRHHAPFLEAFPDFDLGAFLAIDAGFFRQVLGVQFGFAFLLALFVGPGLVSRDLANNGLPLYLCRPFSRAEYALGKFSVLAVLLSAVTWVVGGALFALEANFSGLEWTFKNSRLAVAIFVGSWAWIVVVSLLALALSAWVRWRPVATFMMLMVVLAGGFFGGITNALFRVDWGHLVNLPVVIKTILDGLFGFEPRSGVPVALAWLSLLAFAGFCLFLLSRKVRAYEVVK